MATPEQMAQTMINNLPEKTGKTLEQWMALLTPLGLDKHGQIVKLLKTEYGVTHGFANLIANNSLNAQTSQSAPVDLIASQYDGPKSALKPIYDELIKRLTLRCETLEIAPKKTYVSLRNQKQFGLIQPSTKTRIDVGINLKGQAPSGKLEASGSFNGMVTHRVRVTDIADINDELIDWLVDAFERAAE